MIRSNSLFGQFVRYGLVGGLVWAVDFLIFTALLLTFPAAYLVANGCGKLAGALLGFLLHRNFTFSWNQRDRVLHQINGYVALFFGNLAASSAFLWLLIDLAGANAFLAKILVDALVIASAFLVSRFLVFRAV